MASTPAQLASLVEQSINELEAMFERRRAEGKCGLYRIRTIRVNGEIVDSTALVMTQRTSSKSLKESVSEVTEEVSYDQSLTDGQQNQQNGGNQYSGTASEGGWVVIPDVSETEVPSMYQPPAMPTILPPGHTIPPK
jgi:hypothetical protein